MDTIHADLDRGTRVIYQGSIAAYTGQEMTVTDLCGRRACCSPVVVPGVPYRVNRLELLAADGQYLRHVNPKSVRVA